MRSSKSQICNSRDDARVRHLTFDQVFPYRRSALAVRERRVGEGEPGADGGPGHPGGTAVVQRSRRGDTAGKTGGGTTGEDKTGGGETGPLSLDSPLLCFQAIQSPGVQKVQDKAWSAVVPLVGKLKTFYEFSQKLGTRLMMMMIMMCSLVLIHLLHQSPVCCVSWMSSPALGPLPPSTWSRNRLWLVSLPTSFTSHCASMSSRLAPPPHVEAFAVSSFIGAVCVSDDKPGHSE